jgi:hypothetical protein
MVKRKGLLTKWKRCMNSVVFQGVACFNLSWQKEVNLPSFGDFGGLVSENYLALGNRLLLKFQVLK